MERIEPAVARVVIEVSDRLSAQLISRPSLRQASAMRADTEELLTCLSPEDVEALAGYLDSPDFAAVVTQKRIDDELAEPAREQLYQGLRLAGISDEQLERTTKVLYGVMVAACEEAATRFELASTKIDKKDLSAAAASNSDVLKRLKSLARIQTFAARMRSQVAAQHDKIRLPHIGSSRAVPYEQLYVEPALVSSADLRIGAPGERVLVLGDPGAGKSTLAEKFAHDIAVGESGQVPFLLVLREFTAALDEGGRDLLQYLERRCQDPYNLKPPRDGVEYLLRTGRAVVILDGLDELVQTELRRRVVSLVEGFAHLYPLVPILVTARKIGYEDAPLSTSLFVRSHIAEFGLKQISRYVTRWFELDEATSPAQRKRLAQSFMEDSQRIPEIRSNPLLLTLLCAMYSSDRYLPRNLAQVYERCALMLFDQWDARRGIELPLKFSGRLRGAVQHLAWRMFNAAESGKAQPRTRIVNALTEYLQPKLDDHDESVQTAEEFLAFCTGRAWIMTDVGATESEPLFGFTHRTFLEFFAAEYLVRTHRTAAELWAVLQPTINQWDVVAQIVLQLYERNTEGGFDELLLEALKSEELGFASRALHHVLPSASTVRSITAAAVDRSVALGIDARLDRNIHLTEIDQILVNCLDHSSPANLPSVEKGMSDRIGELIELGNVDAVLLVDCIADVGAENSEPRRRIQRNLFDRHHARLAELRKAVPWGGGLALHSPEILPEVIRECGVKALYQECVFHDSRRPSAAETLFSTTEQPFIAIPVADAIAIAMTAEPTPWVDFPMVAHVSWRQEDVAGNDSLRMLLALPLLEFIFSVGDMPESWPDRDNVPEVVQAFLDRCKRGEIRVAGPAQRPPR
ncbi:hypothetical protein UK23_00055 [Lentzea aerocolonigenes]|uniref:NACHT domain-containing protein n=1 Tax=Lentzea aerocolonigenes TaxID=68170 RepID=A0A0F0HF15_LENAE|nr:NACHT domain-containing protein [Lentzea aerocolonigenes]KJK53436.1 hypothetical protein UK23_00055 [Lentzea aerocolonigenes]